jgi:hypothetical protein
VSTVNVKGSTLGNSLQTLLMADDIVPGENPSYQLCKTIYLYHPLGAKIAEKPVKIAQSQPREIVVTDAPDRAKEQFLEEWAKLGCDKYIFSARVLSKVYGIASLACLEEGSKPQDALELKGIWQRKISFNVYDPLNTAGSLVLNQNPLAMDFQHAQEIRVDGATFHRSRARVVMNEFPIYISYTPSAFGFVGRSVYQRSLFPLKSFVQTMVTNDMVSRKAGVIVAKIKQAGSIITGAFVSALGLKRNVVKEAEVGNVISLSDEGEDIESIDLKNLAEPFGMARKHIIEDIASGTPMPAKMLTEESFAEGFGEGTEDAKEQARYIDGERELMKPLYDFMDLICMHRAWNPEFFATIQKDMPKEYGGMTHEAAFYKWANSFKAKWPSLLTEPESERVKVADVKLRALVAVLEVLMPKLSPDNLAIVVAWVADNMNEMKLLFGSPLYLDYAEIREYVPEAEGAEEGPKKPTPFAKADSVENAIQALRDAVARLPEKPKLRTVANG